MNRKGWLFFHLLNWIDLGYFDFGLLKVISFLNLLFGSALIFMGFLINWFDRLSLCRLRVCSGMGWKKGILLLDDWFGLISDLRVFLGIVKIGWLSVGSLLV